MSMGKKVGEDVGSRPRLSKTVDSALRRVSPRSNPNAGPSGKFPIMDLPRDMPPGYPQAAASCDERARATSRTHDRHGRLWPAHFAAKGKTQRRDQRP